MTQETIENDSKRSPSTHNDSKHLTTIPNYPRNNNNLQCFAATHCNSC